MEITCFSSSRPHLAPSSLVSCCFSASSRKHSRGQSRNDCGGERCREESSFVLCFPAGADRLPAGGATRSGEPEEGPGETDQDAGVRPQTGAVSTHMQPENSLMCRLVERPSTTLTSSEATGRSPRFGVSAD